MLTFYENVITTYTLVINRLEKLSKKPYDPGPHVFYYKE